MNARTNQTAPCPLCKRAIQITNITWVCPCCKGANREWNVWMNCEHCLFSPNYFLCPACSREFESWLFMGKFQDKAGNLLPPAAKPDLNGCLQFALRDVRPGASPEINQDRIMLESFARMLMGTENSSIRFPCRPKSMIAHTIFDDERNQKWLHAFLFATENAEESSRVGQITLKAQLGSDGGIGTTEIAYLEALPTALSF